MIVYARIGSHMMPCYQNPKIIKLLPLKEALVYNVYCSMLEVIFETIFPTLNMEIFLLINGDFHCGAPSQKLGFRLAPLKPPHSVP